MVRGKLLVPFMALSLLGFAVSLVVHAVAWFGFAMVGDEAFQGFFFGLVLVWLPAVICASQLRRHARHEDFWRAIMRGCPAWIRLASTALFVYAIVNFLLNAVLAEVFRQSASHDVQVTVSLRLFSGHWMVFYLTAFTVMYSYCHVAVVNPKCPRGHPVSFNATFCETCGCELPQGDKTGPRT